MYSLYSTLYNVQCTLHIAKEEEQKYLKKQVGTITVNIYCTIYLRVYVPIMGGTTLNLATVLSKKFDINSDIHYNTSAF
jgi:hypothetical protein